MDIGRVGVRVVPDTTGFWAEVKRELKKNAAEIKVGVDPDKAQVDRTARRIKQQLDREVGKVEVEIEADAQEGQIVREAAKAERLAKTAMKDGVELKVNSEQFAREVRRTVALSKASISQLATTSQSYWGDNIRKAQELRVEMDRIHPLGVPWNPIDPYAAEKVRETALALREMKSIMAQDKKDLGFTFPKTAMMRAKVEAKRMVAEEQAEAVRATVRRLQTQAKMTRTNALITTAQTKKIAADAKDEIEKFAPTMKVRSDISDIRDAMTKSRAELEDVTAVTPRLELIKFNQDIVRLRRDWLAETRDLDAEAEIKADLGPAQRQLRKFRTEQILEGGEHAIEIDADTDKARRKVVGLELDLAAIKRKNIEVTAEARADITPAQLEIAKLRGELVGLRAVRPIEIGLKIADTARSIFKAGIRGAVAEAKAAVKANPVVVDIKSRFDDSKLGMALARVRASVEGFTRSFKANLKVTLNDSAVGRGLLAAGAKVKAWAKLIRPNVKLDLEDRPIYKKMMAVGAKLKAMAKAMVVKFPSPSVGGLGNMSLYSTAIVAAVAALVPLIPIAASLGSTLITAMGALGAAPGLLGAMGIAGLAAGLALKDIGKVLGDLKPAFEGVQKSTSKAFWEQAEKPLRAMAKEYLPGIKEGMTTLGSSMGTMFVGFAESSLQALNMQYVFEKINEFVVALTPAVRSFGAAFAKIFQAGLQVLPDLGAWLSTIGERFDAFISRVTDSGAFEKWVRDGASALMDLGGFIVQVGVLLKNIFSPMVIAPLGKYTNGLKAFNAELGKTANQKKITRFFESMHEGIDNATNGLTGMTHILGGVFEGLTKIMPAVGSTYASVMASLGGPIRRLIDTLFDGIEKNILPALDKLGKAIGPALDSLRPVVRDLLSFIGKVGETIADMVRDAKPALDKLAEVFPKVKRVAEDLLEVIKNMWTAVQPALEKLLDVVGSIADAFDKWYHTVDGSSTALKGAGDEAKKASNMFSKLFDPVQMKKDVDDIIKFIEGLVDYFIFLGRTMVAVKNGDMLEFKDAWHDLLHPDQKDNGPEDMLRRQKEEAERAQKMVGQLNKEYERNIAMGKLVDPTKLGFTIPEQPDDYKAPSLPKAMDPGYRKPPGLAKTGGVSIPPPDTSAAKAEMDKFYQLQNSVWNTFWGGLNTGDFGPRTAGSVTNMSTGVKGSMNSLMNSTTPEWDGFWQNVSGKASTSASEVTGSTSTMSSGVSSEFEKANSSGSTSWSSLWQGAQASATAGAGSITGSTAGMGSSVRGTFQQTNQQSSASVTDMWQTARTQTSQGTQGMQQGTSSGLGQVVQFFRGLPSQILGALGSLGGLLSGAGRSLMSGLQSGITAGWNAIQTQVSGFAAWIKANKGPIEYDRKLLVPAGIAIMEGLRKGLTSQMPVLERTLADVTRLIASAGDVTVDPTGAIASVQRASSALAATATAKVVGSYNGLAGAIEGAFPSTAILTVQAHDRTFEMIADMSADKRERQNNYDGFMKGY